MQEQDILDAVPEIEDVDSAVQIEANLERVKAFGEALAKTRDDAVKWRKETGIEDDWDEDEDAYQGVDVANEGSHTYKPRAANGSFEQVRQAKQTRSSLYLNITRPYVDAAAARVADMLMPNDDFPFKYQPTPIANGKLNPVSEAVQGAIDQAQMDAIRKQYETAAEGAQKQVQDWMVEAGWHAEVRKTIRDMTRLGTGVMKGPYPAEVKSRCAVRGPTGAIELHIETKIVPRVKHIPLRNFYPARGCGENFRNGSYCWERDSVTAKQLREFKSLGDEYGYIVEQINEALRRGPQKSQLLKNETGEVADSAAYDIWYGWVLANRDDLIAAGLDDSDLGDLDVAIPSEVVMIDDLVIKASLNPMRTSGDFPFDMVVWQRRDGLPWGSGVARHINTPQRMINAAARHLADNAGASSGPQTIIDQEAIEPADNSGNYDVTPRKVWRRKAGYSQVPIDDAFKVITIPNMQEQLMPIIQFGLKMAEDVTNLPMLMQGQQGSAPDTVGGMTILNNNASVVLRAVIRSIDDCLIETQATRFYEWLMVHGKDDSIKGDYQIDAVGSTSLIERDLANSGFKELAPMSINPAFGLDPELVGEELVKAHRIDPKRVKLSDEKKEKLSQQPPPEAPQVTVAKIREQGATERAKIDTDRDTAFVEAQNQRVAIEAQSNQQEMQLRYQLALLDYANKRQITLDKAKAELTKTAMTLTVQKQLNGANAARPVVEPKGKAPEGMAFQR